MQVYLKITYKKKRTKKKRNEEMKRIEKNKHWFNIYSTTSWVFSATNFPGLHPQTIEITMECIYIYVHINIEGNVTSRKEVELVPLTSLWDHERQTFLRKQEKKDEDE